MDATLINRILFAVAHQAILSKRIGRWELCLAGGGARAIPKKHMDTGYKGDRR